MPNPTGLHGLPCPLYSVLGDGTWVSSFAFLLLPAAQPGTAGQVIYDLAIVAGIGLAMPVAIGVSVLKYRLYAIDKIISRTVSFSPLRRRVQAQVDLDVLGEGLLGVVDHVLAPAHLSLLLREPGPFG